MSLIKLSLGRNNLIIPAQGEFDQWHPGWGRENGKTFFTVISIYNGELLFYKEILALNKSLNKTNSSKCTNNRIYYTFLCTIYYVTGRTYTVYGSCHLIQEPDELWLDFKKMWFVWRTRPCPSLPWYIPDHVSSATTVFTLYKSSERPQIQPLTLYSRARPQI